MLDSSILEEFKLVFEKSRKFINSLKISQPPCKIWSPLEWTNFDQSRHEAMLGCEESGLIAFTIFPGLSVFDTGSGVERVLDKALVFTSDRRENRLSLEQFISKITEINDPTKACDLPNHSGSIGYDVDESTDLENHLTGELPENP